MKRYELSDFHEGWLCGAFSPSIMNTSDFEVGIKSFRAGDTEAKHHQRTAIEITFIVFGEVRIGDEKFGPGEICFIPPLESADFESITDSKLVVIKSPSVPTDKVLD